MVQGVAHNIGFGKSIIHNESFAKGDYSTAFIPDFYPDGYKGDQLEAADQGLVSLVAAKIKNTFLGFRNTAYKDEKVMYVTIIGKGEEEDMDWKVEASDCGNKYTMTDMASGESHVVALDSFNFEHNSLVKMGGNKVMQLLGTENDFKFDFYFKGGKVETYVYDESQFKYKHFMAPPVKIDTSKSLLSPMPGAVVSVSVEPGQTIVDGQELCVIEAMKMQNILKSEREGKVKSVQVKAGDSVAVD